MVSEGGKAMKAYTGSMTVIAISSHQSMELLGAARARAVTSSSEVLKSLSYNKAFGASMKNLLCPCWK
jgi:hypothetical protein